MTSGRFIIPAKQVSVGLREMRVATGECEADLAEKVEMPLASYKAIERGEGEVSIGTLFALADALNAAPERFFSSADS